MLSWILPFGVVSLERYGQITYDKRWKLHWRSHYRRSTTMQWLELWNLEHNYAKLFSSYLHTYCVWKHPLLHFAVWSTFVRHFLSSHISGVIEISSAKVGPWLASNCTVVGMTINTDEPLQVKTIECKSYRKLGRFHLLLAYWKFNAYLQIADASHWFSCASFWFNS